MDRKDKNFKLQIGSKQDNVSVDRLKPVFFNEKVCPALSPPRVRPPRFPPPPAANPLPPVRITNKSICFSHPSRQNPAQVALLPRRFVSALLLMPLFGGNSVADQILQRHLLCPYLQPNQRRKSRVQPICADRHFFIRFNIQL